MTYKNIIASTIAIAALGMSTMANAHPRLLRSTPSANAIVAAPTRITLSFSEKLIAPMSSGDLVATSMSGHGNMAPMKIAGVTAGVTGGGTTLVLALKHTLAPGSYRLNWHAVSVDTHRVQGMVSFKVK